MAHEVKVSRIVVWQGKKKSGQEQRKRDRPLTSVTTEEMHVELHNLRS